MLILFIFYLLFLQGIFRRIAIILQRMINCGHVFEGTPAFDET